MRCSACGHENREEARFCDTCGAQLHLATAAAPAGLPEAFAGGRYRVIDLVGDGVRKRVFHAHDTRLDREVAIALLNPVGLDDAERTRVEREVRLLARLGSHPNIVTLYDVADLDGTPGIVYEYLPGGSLRDLMRVTGGRGLPVRDVVRIGVQMARALDAVHREHVFFRDLKPGNVLLTGDGTAKLCDFGYALRAGQLRVTDPNLTVGSPAYIAPERIARSHFDHRSDLYSLGVVLYEMLAGHPPFAGDDVQEIGDQHLHAAPAPLADTRPGLPDALVGLVVALLAKAVADRPDSAAQVAVDLDRIVQAL
jgi:serine/threonine-protein kinase